MNQKQKARNQARRLKKEKLIISQKPFYCPPQFKSKPCTQCFYENRCRFNRNNPSSSPYSNKPIHNTLNDYAKNSIE